MNIFAVAVICIAAAFLAVLLKKYNPEYSMAVALIASLAVLALVIKEIIPIIGKVTSLFNSTDMAPQYAAILFKCLGVCVITQFAGDTCRDVGESALASKIELAGKIALVVAAFPLFEQLLGVVTSIVAQR